jgi:alkylation response protein AidB-like acyl-CoA dehydrogenase
MMRFNLTEEELMVQKMARDFTNREIEPLAEQIERENKTPRGLLKRLADIGLLGMTLPKEYGGAGASILSDTVAIEEIAKAGVGAEWLLSMNNSIADTIYHFGSEEIRMKYLEPVCKGEDCLSILFTEPATGSDPRMITTTAVPDGDNYIVNGQKRFISWAAWDGHGTLYVKDETERISCLLLKKNLDGYTTGPLYKKVGGHAQESVDVYFENVKVPKENLIGDKGKGFDVLLWWIAAEKMQQSAASLGIAEAALDESIKYSKERILRAGPISQMQGIQWTLAEMQTKIEAIRWLTYKCACLREEQAPNWITMAALNKLFAIPAAVSVTLLGMQLHSAYGYTKDFKIGRLHEAALGGLGIATSLELNKSIVGNSLVR